MEEETRAFVWVWLVAVPAALTYCHSLAFLLRPGKNRLFAVLPVIILFYFLPFSFSSVHVRVISASILVWLATFKLLLFAFHRGPLCSATNLLSLPAFIAIASLSIMIERKSPQIKRTKGISLLGFAFKGFLLAFIAFLYPRRHRLYRGVALLLYSLYLYLLLDLLLALIAIASTAILPTRTNLEAQFKAPYLSSSLQDFWGRRWNLVASNILRAAVHDPVRALWGRGAGVMASFLVSGLMHEIVFFYMSIRLPNGQVGSFFVVHGICTVAEMFVKKWWMGRGMRPLPPLLTAPLTVGFVVWTSWWMFMPQIVRSAEKEADEYFRLLTGIGKSAEV